MAIPATTWASRPCHAMHFLTFDLGTTLYKVALFDDSGNLLAVERAAPPIVHPQARWNEVPLFSFWKTVTAAVAALRDREGGFESLNAIFQSPQSGEMLVAATLKLLK